MLRESKLFCVRLWGILLFTDPISDEPARLQAPVTMFINRQSSQLQANEVQFPEYVMGFAKCWKRMRFDQTAHCFVAVDGEKKKKSETERLIGLKNASLFLFQISYNMLTHSHGTY